MRLLHLVGYRGNFGEFPDDTLPALRSAISLGVRFIALDVHLSPDGVPMVCDKHQLSAALCLLEGRPEMTVFVSLARASVARLGHDQVISRVVRAMRPFRSHFVLVSKDLATIHTARARAGCPVGWEIPAFDAHTRLKFEAFRPEYLFCDRALLPARISFWRGPWRWAVTDVSDLDGALDLARRGADFVVTRDVRSLGEAMRAHAAERTARTVRVRPQALALAAEA